MGIWMTGVGVGNNGAFIGVGMVAGEVSGERLNLVVGVGSGSGASMVEERTDKKLW